MNLLALDTSTEYLSLALILGEERYSRDIHAVQSHSKIILPEIQGLLTQANVQLKDLHGIAFGSGPGSFTGLRIACGVAQGLAFGLNLPVVGVCSLLALAEQADASRVVTCLDARMGELYHAVYEKQAGSWQTIQAPALYKPEALPAVEGSDWVGIGSGWNVCASELQACYQGQICRLQADVQPSALSMARIALADFNNGQSMPAHLAAPLYVRNKVALTSLERAAL